MQTPRRPSYVIDGGGQDAVVVAGASRVSLGGIEVRNGLNGIVALNGAHLSLTSVNVHDNAVSGISLQTGSSGVLSEVVIQHNGLHGLDLQSGSAATVTGSLTSTANRVFGLKDAASQLNTFNDGDGLLIQYASTLTVFNTPQFSGAPGFSTINSHHNTRSGARVATASTLTLVNQARVIGTQNGTLGLVADNGVGITLVNSTLTGNTSGDLQMTFGTRADLQTLTFGTATCDATVLVRGTSGIVCPQ